MRFSKTYTQIIASLALTSACFPVSVLAQGVLEEVIVTAQKREQNLQGVPVAVSAYTGEMLEKSGVRDMFELANLAPSLTVDTSTNSNIASFGIRGIFTSSQNFGLESSVGLYVDGVYRARQGSMLNNMLDLSEVQVLRGPQGTLFGRNTPAGAVLVNSAKPDFDESGFLKAGVGDYNLVEVSGAKSFTLIGDELAFRLTGFGTQRDGFVDVIGKEVQKKDALNDRNRWGFRLQSLYTPNEDLTVRVIADHSEVDEACCGAGTTKNNFYAENPPDKTGTDLIIENVLGGTVPLAEDFYDYEVSSSFIPFSKNTDEGITLDVQLQTDHFLFTSISGYRQHESSDSIDGDFSDIDGLIRATDLDQKQFSQELRITGETERITYVTGLYYYYATLDSNVETVSGFDGAALFGIPPELFPGGITSYNFAEQTHYSTAAFGQVDFALAESLTLTTGLRWSFENKDLQNTFTESGPVPFAGQFFDPIAPRENADENLDESKLTGTVKLTWFVDDFSMLYASYGTGYKSGGINTDRINVAFDPLFGPETAESYELGMKLEFPAQALRVNLALHRTDTDDLQTVSFQGTGFLLDNAGKAETYGGELDMLWQPTDSTTLTVAYAYNHAEYAQFEEGPCWVGTPWQTSEPDPGDNGNGTCSRSGGMVAGSAENVLSLSASQQFRASENLGGFVHAEYSYSDERMADVNNDPEKLDGSYGVTNARVGLVFDQYDVSLILWARNIFDVGSTNLILDVSGQPGRFVGFYKEPVTWGVSLEKTF